MKHHIKFENLEEELVNLQEVLKNSLQNEVLEIKKLNKSCDKYLKISEEFSDLNLAKYVIYSKFMNDGYHKLETFVFVDESGNSVCNLSGRDLELYDMITTCDNLVEAKDY